MSDLDDAEARINDWLQPLDGDAGPCGPDLEYDNDFLALTQAAAGKPETQFAAAEPPDWPTARDLAEGLLDRSRDLRVAIYWLRSGVRQLGLPALVPGLRLLNGMLEQLWDDVHPLPDPDDGDPYARVNALTLLREPEGLLGDLRVSHVIRDRAVGEISGRMVELAAALADPIGDEQVPSLESLRQMTAAALERSPSLGEALRAAAEGVQQLEAQVAERLPSDAPDFGPLAKLVRAAVSLLPDESGGAGTTDEDGADAAGAPASSGRGLSGTVSSREDALRAIDMVCAYLERHEPTNPAPLFLRRARQLVGHNFLQLMKELAPSALPEVARMVGVDPDSVETPGPT